MVLTRTPQQCCSHLHPQTLDPRSLARTRNSSSDSALSRAAQGPLLDSHAQDCLVMAPHHSPPLSLPRQGPHTRQPQAAPAHSKHHCELLHYTLLPTSPRTPAAAAGGSCSLRVEGGAAGRDQGSSAPLSLSPGSPATELMECGYALGVSTGAGEEEGDGGMVGEEGSVLPVSFGGFGSLDASSAQACFWGHSIKDYHATSPTLNATTMDSWAGLRRPVSAPLHPLSTPQPQSGLRADLPSPEGRSAPCVPALEPLRESSLQSSCAESMSDASSRDGSATPPLGDDAFSSTPSSCLIVDPLGGIPHWCAAGASPALTPSSSLPCPCHAGGECSSSSSSCGVSHVLRRSAVRSMSADHSSGMGPRAGVGLEAGSGRAGPGEEAGDIPGMWSLSGWLLWWHLDAKQQQQQEQEQQQRGELELEAVGV